MDQQLFEQHKQQKRAYHAAKKEARQEKRSFYPAGFIPSDHYVKWLNQFPKVKRIAMVQKVPAHLRNKYGTNNPVS